MKYEVKKSFIKDLKAIKDFKIKQKIEALIQSIEKVNSLAEIPNIEPMKGFQFLYRIKIDYRYRIGIFFNNTDTITLLIV